MGATDTEAAEPTSATSMNLRCNSAFFHSHLLCER